MIHILLLTGMPGVGKTTVLRKVAGALSERRVAGFYTEEIRVRGARRGFRAVTFDGKRSDMARVDFPGPHRVSKYGVDVAVIDELAESLIAGDRRPDLYLIDEIGKMECLSRRFVAVVRAIFDGPVPVVAAVAQKGGGFIAEVKERPDAELWPVTRANRDEMPARVLGWLREQARLGKRSAVTGDGPPPHR